ncbi:hypothetical protein ElyMa_004193800 [Elysia marginata]|uniref:VCBS repeat-containing protein n=1 Tax=Elysia marginata TaxID=1093978 RepID=A0AAV4GLM5_9GAST|nr:hypothetical protein ElyMa_004193800 [Elysia marginata]
MIGLDLSYRKPCVIKSGYRFLVLCKSFFAISAHTEIAALSSGSREDFRTTQNKMGLSPFILVLVLSAFLQGASSQFSAQPKLLGTFPYRSAGFLSLSRNTSAPGVKYDLLLSSFSFRESDVSVVLDVGARLKNVSAIRPRSINKSMRWPNDIKVVPEQVLESKVPYVIIPDGFLVPGKERGSLTLQPLFGGATSIISGTKGDWFYHMVEWVDMNKDGTLDALTCKTQKPLLGSFKGNMVWYSNPKDHSISTPWTENVIAVGPDVLFTFVKTNVSGVERELIVTAEYFNLRVRIFWTESPKQDWSQQAMIKSRDIDTISKGDGRPFDVIVSDVNKDGSLDVVLSLNDASNGSVVIYEFPADFRTGTFKRHVVASGYVEETGAPNAGAPGSIQLMPTQDQSRKPSILVAGDDAGTVSILDPAKPTDPQDWHYTRTDVLHTEKSSTGTALIADVDGDRRPEIFASSYDEGLIYVYRV